MLGCGRLADRPDPAALQNTQPGQHLPEGHQDQRGCPDVGAGDVMTGREAGDRSGAAVVGVKREPEPESHASHPGDDRDGAGPEHQPPTVAPDTVSQAAEAAEHNAGGGQDHDDGQVVAAHRERPQVDDPRDGEQDQRKHHRPERQLMRADLAEDNQDEQDIDHVVGDAH